MVTETELDGLLTPQEVADILGITRCSVYRWLKRGWLIKITLPNGTIRIPRASLNIALMEKK